jgi:hypothetical protein
LQRQSITFLDLLTMSVPTGTKSEFSAPLYQDLFEFIDVMGIKHQRVFEAFGISRSFWFKLKRQHMNGLSLENMHKFATYFNLPPEKVIMLCYMTYSRGLSQQRDNADNATDSSPDGLVDIDIDADFPPIG